MSPAGRKPSPDQMADLFRRMLEGANPRDGYPHLPTDDEFQAATGWFQLNERVRWRQITRPPYAPPSPGPAVEPEPVEERTPSEPWTVSPARFGPEPQPGEESPEPEPAPVEAPPAPAKRKSRFKSLEL